MAFPAVAVLVREPAEGLARHPLPGEDAAALSGLSVREALTGSCQFWLLAAAVFLVAMAANGTIVHVVPLLTDRGLPLTIAASMLSAVGLASIVGRLLCGYLADRTFCSANGRRVFSAAVPRYQPADDRRAPSFAAHRHHFAGFALGCEIDMMGFLTTRYFGLRQFGVLYGYLFAMFYAGSALGPYPMGVSFDTFAHTTQHSQASSSRFSLRACWFPVLAATSFPQRRCTALQPSRRRFVTGAIDR